MSELFLFGSTFGVVFFLGFQSLCVNSGHYWLAGINSLLIGTFNLILFKTAPQVQGTAEIACYLLGGPLGILSAMWVHRNVVVPLREEAGQRKCRKMVRGVCAENGLKEVG
jgi:hypothetical protein